MTIDELEAAYDLLMDALNIATEAKAPFLGYFIMMAILEVHASIQEVCAAD